MRLWKCLVASRNSIARLRIFVFVSNVKFSGPNSKTFTGWSSEKVFKEC